MPLSWMLVWLFLMVSVRSQWGGGGAQGLFLGGAEIIARTVVCGPPQKGDSRYTDNTFHGAGEQLGENV